MSVGILAWAVLELDDEPDRWIPHTLLVFAGMAAAFQRMARVLRVPAATVASGNRCDRRGVRLLCIRAARLAMDNRRPVVVLHAQMRRLSR
jgi:hypothetical protein